jgi:hypothetical protein
MPPIYVWRRCDRKMCQRLRLDEPVAEIAVETGTAQATSFRWKRQAPIDAGVIAGTPTVDADELAAAHKCITELKAELAFAKTAASPDGRSSGCRLAGSACTQWTSRQASAPPSRPGQEAPD